MASISFSVQVSSEVSSEKSLKYIEINGFSSLFMDCYWPSRPSNGLILHDAFEVCLSQALISLLALEDALNLFHLILQKQKRSCEALRSSAKLFKTFQSFSRLLKHLRATASTPLALRQRLVLLGSPLDVLCDFQQLKAMKDVL